MGRKPATDALTSTPRYKSLAKRHYFAVCKRLCKEWNISLRLVLNNMRWRPALYVRSLVFKELAAAGYSFTSIANAAGCNHTTVSWNCKRPREIEIEFLESDPENWPEYCAVQIRRGKRIVHKIRPVEEIMAS